MRNILILILAVLVPFALQRIKIPGKPEEKQETTERSRKLSGAKTVTQYAPRLTKKFVQTCRQEYVAFDTETTGLSSKTDRIIEISAVRFRNFVPVESWSTLIHANVPIGAQAAEVNHISEADLEDAPKEYKAMHQFADFVGEDVLTGKIPLVAHNVSFDAAFLAKALSRSRIHAEPLFVDTLALSRRDSPELGRYKLSTVAEHYGIAQTNAHRAEDDALVCGQIFAVILQGNGDNGAIEGISSGAPKVSAVIAQPGKENPSSPLYKKRCVFTGDLQRMSRREAAQALVDIGGIYAVTVTATTDYLILGEQGYSPEDGFTQKRLDAERLIAEGSNLQILTEDQFLDLLAVK